MTDNKVPHIGGRPLTAAITEHRRLITQRVLTRIREQVPAYQRLPQEELAGDIAQVIERNLRYLVEMMSTGNPPSAEELAALRESAARRAEEGIPVEFVLTAYHRGVQEVLDFITERAQPDDLADVIAATALGLRHLEAVTAAVAAGYLEERQSISGDEQLTRHALLAALLGDGDISDAAERAGIGLPERYLVLNLAVGPHPDESAPGVDGAIAARRKLRRLRVELQRRIREPVLTTLADNRGVALVPLATALDWPAVRRLVSGLASAAGGEVTAGAEAAAPSGVKAAAELGRNLVDLATMLGREPGAYRLDDLLLEYQLSRPSEARDRLAAQLDPLDGHPELLRTLETFIRRRRARRPTAAELHLHPNTVDYRLRRVASLTGLDPMDAGHTARLEAALVARVARTGQLGA